MKQLGCETTFIDGLRVTDSQTRDIAMMVFAGQLNKQLVAAVGEAGQPAIGICGGDLRMVLATEEEAAGPGIRPARFAASMRNGSRVFGMPVWCPSFPAWRWALTANTTT